MSSYSASVAVADGQMTVTRPLTAPDEVQDLIDSAVYDVRSKAGSVVSVALTVETAADSGTPIGDSIGVTDQQPVAEVAAADDETAASVA